MKWLRCVGVRCRRGGRARLHVQPQRLRVAGVGRQRAAASRAPPPRPAPRPHPRPQVLSHHSSYTTKNPTDCTSRSNSFESRGLLSASARHTFLIKKKCFIIYYCTTAALRTRHHRRYFPMDTTVSLKNRTYLCLRGRQRSCRASGVSYRVAVLYSGGV